MLTNAQRRDATFPVCVAVSKTVGPTIVQTPLQSGSVCPWAIRGDSHAAMASAHTNTAAVRVIDGAQYG